MWIVTNNRNASLDEEIWYDTTVYGKQISYWLNGHLLDHSLVPSTLRLSIPANFLINFQLFKSKIKSVIFGLLFIYLVILSSKIDDEQLSMEDILFNNKDIYEIYFFSR